MGGCSGQAEQSRAGDGLQRPLRSRFQPHLTRGVRLPTIRWRGGEVSWPGSCHRKCPSMQRVRLALPEADASAPLASMASTTWAVTAERNTL